MPEVALHTPQELIDISNAAHVAEGIFFALFGILTIARGGGFLSRAAYRLWMPLIGLAAGLTLVLFFFADHYNQLPQAWRWIITDMQQRQHLYMAGILLAGSLIALFGLLLPTNWLDAAMIAALLAIGLVFLFHPQNGAGQEAARAMLIHAGIGTGLILAVLFHAGATFIRGWHKALTVTVGVLLVAVAALFVSYREPPMTAESMSAGEAGTNGQ